MLQIGVIIALALSLAGASTGLSNSLITAPAKQNKVSFSESKYLPAAAEKTGAKEYSALAVESIIFDRSGWQILYQKNPSTPVPMASLTKMMTALVILQNHQPDEIVTIPEDLPALGAEDQKIGVLAGEKFVLRDLMQALLIHSANDVANALAVWDAGSEQKFADKMNEQAKLWGLKASTFKNPSGLDEFGHQSSAQDLLVLANLLLESPIARTTANKKSATIYSRSGKPYLLTATNKDLSLPYVYGLKTGYTVQAGQCLILLGRDKAGHEVLAVLLNSPDRFLEGKNMLDWTFANYVWE